MLVQMLFKMSAIFTIITCEWFHVQRLVSVLCCKQYLVVRLCLLRFEAFEHKVWQTSHIKLVDILIVILHNHIFKWFFSPDSPLIVEITVELN